MAGVGLLIEVKLRPGCEPQFLAATRLYRFRTQHEAGALNCEVLKSEGVEGAFVVYAAFADGGAVERHAASARKWLDSVAQYLAVPVEVRRTEIAIGRSEPPPLPKKPALESASSFSGFQGPAPASAAREARAVPPPRLKLPRLEVVIEEMEFASAKDGFLRGMPDPCFLLACYDLDADALPLGRVIYRFTLDEAAPCAMRGAERLLDVAVPAGRFPFRCLFVLVAFEENGGADVKRMHQELGRSEGLLMWGSEQALPNPLPFAEYASTVLRGHAQRVQMVCHGTVLDDTMTDDTLVGTGAAVVELGRGADALVHFHVCSPDRANDWTLRFSLRFA